MQIKKTIGYGQSVDVATEETISAYSTDLTVGPQSNIRMVQSVRLIWLDQSIDENNADCRNTIGQLRRVVHTINTCTDIDTCLQFLQDTNEEKACLIISGSHGQHIVPRVHHMFQVDSIFIFCSDKEYHQQWITKWSKIKGVFTEITLICEALKNAAKECEHNAISISIMATGDVSKKNLDQLDPYFMYLQIMKEILLDINFEPKHFQQYIEYCCTTFVENDRELRNITKFERQYADKRPIWWYTCESFLYPMVNRVLRTMDIDIIIKMGFFIKDLHNHIKELHNEQFIDVHSQATFTVYRGQGMEKTQFDHLTKTKGGLISFNNFLSTSENRTVSLGFANRALTNPDLVGVLFIMTIDPSQSTTPFAAIKDVSAIKSEDEILFAMQTVFRIGDMTSIGGNSRLFQVELTLTGDDDKDLRQLTDCIREGTFPDAEGWYQLGCVLYTMGQFAKCEEVYQILLEQPTNESGKASIYGQIGLAKSSQGQYKEAITFYEKVVEIYKKDLPSNNVSLAVAYNNIGMVYDNMGEYSKALSYYEKSLEIKQQSLPPSHPALAASYNNIGMLYNNMGNYSKALSYYEKSLEIRQQSLPPNHPDLADSNYNIGLLYENMGNYSKAHSSYERAVNMGQQSLPPNHPYLRDYRKVLEDIKNKL